MKKIFIIVVIALVSGAGNAQNSFTLSYPISFPMSDMHDYVSATSFRGFSMEFNRRQKPNLDIGLETGWSTFYQRVDTKTYTEGSASISGVQYRYVNLAPILVGAKWYKPKEKTEPYFGLGLGVMYVNQSTDFGLYRISKESWPFTIRPELGFLYHIHAGLSALIGAKYYYGVKTSDLPSQQYLSVNVGFVFHN